MFTVDENLKIKDIKNRALNGEAVTKEDRQWVLDMFRREGIPLLKDAYDGAKEMGFDVEGITVKTDD